MKLFLSVLISLGKIYLGFKILSWVFNEFSHPESHNFSEIEVYVVLVIFDVWITSQNQVLEEYIKNKED